jgi:hypothetical protein
MIKVIAYNPKEQIFRFETINKGIEGYYALLECQTFDVINLDEHISLYVDDEGLFVSNSPISNIEYKNYKNKIAGNIVITGGVDEEGNTKSCEISISEAKNIIKLSNYVTK